MNFLSPVRAYCFSVFYSSSQYFRTPGGRKNSSTSGAVYCIAAMCACRHYAEFEITWLFVLAVEDQPHAYHVDKKPIYS